MVRSRQRPFNSTTPLGGLTVTTPRAKHPSIPSASTETRGRVRTAGRAATYLDNKSPNSKASSSKRKKNQRIRKDSTQTKSQIDFAAASSKKHLYNPTEAIKQRNTRRYIYSDGNIKGRRRPKKPTLRGEENHLLELKKKNRHGTPARIKRRSGRVQSRPRKGHLPGLL